jgi:2-polyprenyl-3-methyl-5-hydroxy-6-metoxy-1,4-benzoquinol methylase
MNWQRISSFEPGKIQKETWIYKSLNRQKKYAVEVTLGKEVDVCSLKAGLIDDFAKKVSLARGSRTAVYSSRKNLERVGACPVCGNPSNNAEKRLVIYGASYYECRKCSHYYLLYRPTEKSLKRFYIMNKEYQSTYTDKRTLDVRVNQVVIPKLKYVLKKYRDKYGRLPKMILDVGAGSGHFVYACHKLGIPCKGFEISESGRAFCKDNFKIDLLDIDFMKAAEDFNCDVVTFWGLIEHVPAPVKMLKAAKSALSRQGMVIADVPRWNCLDTAIHAALPESVVRHLDPMDHIQCFSDSSLATAFMLSDFDIIAAWYFGMDAFELLTQLAYVTKDDKVISAMKEKIPLLQEKLDLAKLSDFMVFVGIPGK